jgi:hypothetical protein
MGPAERCGAAFLLGCFPRFKIQVGIQSAKGEQERAQLRNSAKCMYTLINTLVYLSVALAMELR